MLTPDDLRGLGHRAVTEGVNLKYVEVMRRAVYVAADEIERLREGLLAVARLYPLQDWDTSEMATVLRELGVTWDKGGVTL